MAQELSVYLHIPFCDGKCPYCDFYSAPPRKGELDEYAKQLGETVLDWGRKVQGKARTVYFGGGTPSLLGANRLSRLLEQVDRAFPITAQGEITCEVNPTRLEEGFFQRLHAGGFNRISMGLQSAHRDELELLGRRHQAQEAAEAFALARDSGFHNISLDLMMGLPGGSEEKLRGSISFAAALGAEHISSYLLKVEPGTSFHSRGVVLPPEEEVADQYLLGVEALESRGYSQYEISNFAKPGKESQHNLAYWQGKPYLGMGPGAHSFLEGRRFFYASSLTDFMEGKPPVDDGPGGDFEEYAMLALRLTKGLSRERCGQRFGKAGEKAFDRMVERAKSCPSHFLRGDKKRIAFTPKGFLVSNSLTVKLLS